MKKIVLVLALGLLVSAAASFAASAPADGSYEARLAEYWATTPLSAALETPAPISKACGAYCDSPGCYNTAIASAIGSTCAIAQTNLQTQLKGVANAFCGTLICQFVTTYTQACTLISPGTYQVKGFGTHGCRDSTC